LWCYFKNSIMKVLAKASGIAYLLIFISGFYANFSILETLVDLSDGEQTTFNIMSNLIQFRKGLLGFLIMLVSDVFLIWSLFKITEPNQKVASYVASFFRGLHALFFLIGLTKLVKVYKVTSEGINATQIQTIVIDLLSNFDELWTIGLIFFGVHLLLLGCITFKASYVPKYIAIVLTLAALGYFIDGFSKLFLPSYNDYKSYFEAIVVLTGVLGELSFTVWLLVKGFSQKKFKV